MIALISMPNEPQTIVLFYNHSPLHHEQAKGTA
jgi:hypothetical protein